PAVTTSGQGPATRVLLKPMGIEDPICFPTAWFGDTAIHLHECGTDRRGAETPFPTFLLSNAAFTRMKMESKITDGVCHDNRNPNRFAAQGIYLASSDGGSWLGFRDGRAPATWKRK